VKAKKSIRNINLLQLPEECLSMILSNLMTPDLFSAIASCAMLRRIGSDPTLLYGCIKRVFSSPLFKPEGHKDKNQLGEKNPPFVPKSYVLQSWGLLTQLMHKIIHTARNCTITQCGLTSLDILVRYHPECFYKFPYSVKNVARMIEYNPKCATVLKVIPSSDNFLKETIEFWMKNQPAKKTSEIFKLRVPVFEIKKVLC